MKLRNQSRKLVYLFAVVALLTACGNGGRDERKSSSLSEPSSSQAKNSTSKTESSNSADTSPSFSSSSGEKKPVIIVTAGDANHLRMGKVLTLGVENFKGVVEWSSSDPTVLVSEGNGVFRGLKEGTAKAVAETSGQGRLELSVVVFDDQELILNLAVSGKQTLEYGAQLDLRPAVFYGEEDVTDEATVSYSFEDEDSRGVLSVENGLVEAIGEGKAVLLVQATYYGHEPAVSRLEFEVAPIVSLVLDAEKVNLSLLGYGEAPAEKRISAKVYVNNKESNDAMITFESDHPEIATVDKNGFIHAISAGEATITVIATHGGKTVSESCPVTVVKERVELAGVSYVFEIGEDLDFANDKITESKVKSDLTLSNVTSLRVGGKEILDSEHRITTDGTKIVGSKEERDIEITTAKATYIAQAKIVNAFVRSAADLANLKNHLSQRSSGESEYPGSVLYEGYVELLSDIDLAGTGFAGICPNDPHNTSISGDYFGATFEGNGHTISNYEGSVGFLGYTGGDAKLSNLTLIGHMVSSSFGATISANVWNGTLVLDHVNVLSDVINDGTPGIWSSSGLALGRINGNVTVTGGVYEVRNGRETYSDLGVENHTGGGFSVFGYAAYHRDCLLASDVTVVGWRTIYADDEGPDGNSVSGFPFLPHEVLQGVTYYDIDDGDCHRFEAIAKGYSLDTSASKNATCTEAGADVYRKEGEDDISVALPALGHDFDESGTCTRCGLQNIAIDGGETDVKDGYAYGTVKALQSLGTLKRIIVNPGEGNTRTIASDALPADGILKFEKSEAKGADTLVVVQFLYENGSTATVNLHVYSLLIDDESELRSMNDYLVMGNSDLTKPTWSIGYFKMVADVSLTREFSATQSLHGFWTRSDGTSDGSNDYGHQLLNSGSVITGVGFRGVFDGNDKAIHCNGNCMAALIGVTDQGAVVKNLSIDAWRCASGFGVYYAAFVQAVCGGVFENLSLSVSSAIDTSLGDPGLFSGVFFGGYEGWTPGPAANLGSIVLKDIQVIMNEGWNSKSIIDFGYYALFGSRRGDDPTERISCTNVNVHGDLGTLPLFYFNTQAVSNNGGTAPAGIMAKVDAFAGITILAS